MIELLFAVSLWAGEPAVAPGEPSSLWPQLRQAYLGYLGTSGAGGQAGAFLSSSTVGLAADDLRDRHGADIIAVYDEATRGIRFDRAALQEVSLSLHNAELQPERVRPFIERTAPTLVHELRHAMDHAALGDAPSFREHELSAYADQALFLRERLAADAAYRGLARVDAAMRPRLDETATRGPWWLVPLGSKAQARLKDAGDVVRQEHPELTPQELTDWFLVRAAAGGMDRFRRALERFGYVAGPSCMNPPAKALERARSDAAYVRRQLAVLRAAGLPEGERGRRESELQRRLASADARARFWDDPAALARSTDYHRRALETRRRRLEEVR